MSNVYVLYTGGTIGCIGKPLAPMPASQFAQLVASMPGLAQGQVAGLDVPIQFTIEPYTVGGQVQTLDSSNMNPADWVNIAIQLAANYAKYDGFVVLHGTDTMGFTASALSFLLQGLSKPVILTGSQIPLSSTLNDALPNLVGAITLAGKQPALAEVCIYFDSLLLRGNRAVKVNANQFAAFNSPNYPPLATVGTIPTVNTALLLPI
ncbi:asparaginase domain-containing protein [Corallococcus exiguus]|uniref:asparaginase domain-containing protein n=1 Tax=Corallococcus exiguus TaxID=83462 RepID=UPI001560EEBD|nr:asparaginase domain-containing protein [Corallococcus exiguus]NRD49568.1 asparaginase [Corallococcus exiguus]